MIAKALVILLVERLRDRIYFIVFKNLMLLPDASIYFADPGVANIF